MKYLLDTNAVIAVLNVDEKFLNKMQQYNENDFVISSIVLSELYYGAYKSQRVAQNIQKIKLLPFSVLDFNDNDAEMAGNIRADLESKGTPIGTYDTLIAGQAVAQNLILITHNVREFERVKGLNFEDWLK